MGLLWYAMHYVSIVSSGWSLFGDEPWWCQFCILMIQILSAIEGGREYPTSITSLSHVTVKPAFIFMLLVLSFVVGVCLDRRLWSAIFSCPLCFFVFETVTETEGGRGGFLDSSISFKQYDLVPFLWCRCLSSFWVSFISLYPSGMLERYTSCAQPGFCDSFRFNKKFLAYHIDYDDFPSRKWAKLTTVFAMALPFLFSMLLFYCHHTRWPETFNLIKTIFLPIHGNSDRPPKQVFSVYASWNWSYGQCHGSLGPCLYAAMELFISISRYKHGWTALARRLLVLLLFYIYYIMLFLKCCKWHLTGVFGIKNQITGEFVFAVQRWCCCPHTPGCHVDPQRSCCSHDMCQFAGHGGFIDINQREPPAFDISSLYTRVLTPIRGVEPPLENRFRLFTSLFYCLTGDNIIDSKVY